MSSELPENRGYAWPWDRAGTEQPSGGAEWVAEALCNQENHRPDGPNPPAVGRPRAMRTAERTAKEMRRDEEHNSSALSRFQALGLIASLLRECFHCILTTISGHQ